MDEPRHPDWSLLRSFLAVAEAGSLSAAARELGLSQPTLGRQIADLERDLGVALFDRHPRGLRPTEAGAALIVPARTMREAAAAVALAAAGRATKARGTVRLTASVFVAHHLLPPILARLRHDAPEIVLDLVASDASDNLLFREADIALRMYRPTQLDMVTRHLGDLRLGFFAAQSYIARRGTPARPEDLPDHDLLGYDRDERLIAGLRAAGLPATRDWFVVRCDNQTAYWELVRAGAGIGIGQATVAAADPGMVQVLADAPLPVLPVWLTAHPAQRHAPRVARVWDALAAGLQPHLS
jgi:DNA-binding transcriptional LysR family regulator